MSGEGECVSRPSSLVLEAPPPDREPLHFDVQLIGAPPEVEQLVNNIKQVAEDFLYHWKTFPIVLPQSRFSGSGNSLSDIIIPPPCDELDTAALDAGTDPEPLSPKQLQSIRERGEFEVPSRLFPGQTHVWRVARWLQRGRVRARDDRLRHIARAAALVLVGARGRLVGTGPLSLRASLVALREGLYRLLDLLIGMPSMEARDLEKKIREERSRYLVAELICKSEHEEDIANLAAWVRSALRRGEGKTEPAPPLPLHYSTPQRTAIDLRLLRRSNLRRAAPALQSILERESRGWFLHFRERTAARLAAQKLPPHELEDELRAAAAREYVSRVCAALSTCPALTSLGSGTSSLLADQLLASALLDRAEERARRRLRAALTAAEARLRASHPVLARSAAWRAPRLAAAAKRVRRDMRWAAREEAAQAMAAHRLHQHRYFLLRDLAFLRDREPLLAAELRVATQPTRTFTWRGRHYTDTRWPGWRLANLAQRAKTWGLEAIRLTATLVWDSPVSLRTLLRTENARDAELSQVECGARTQPLSSRLRARWRHVAKERARGDAQPDTGLEGSGCGRGGRLCRVAAVAALWSVALVALVPLCALCAAAALLAVLLVPVLAPPAALVAHVANALVYDFDCPRPGKLNRWFPLLETVMWRVGVLGVLQPVVAVVAAALCPAAALLLLTAGFVWECLRAAWECVWWRAVMWRGARVPRHEAAYCRRVGGPGLTARSALRLSAAQAAAGAAARAELDALSAWQARTEKEIERPLRDYEHFVDACFGPFSVKIAETGSYQSLQRECSALAGEVRRAVEARRRELASPLSATARARCRLPPAELSAARAAAALETKRAWRRELTPPDWWAARGLEPDDWRALGAAALVDAFDADILVPLEEGAASLPLEEGMCARAWEARVARCGPPDVLGGAEGAGVCAPRVPPPSLDLLAFSPRAPRYPPLPSPATVALLLHNRDSDNAVPLESELCAEILRRLEDAPDADSESVERYRGGGSSDGSSSDADDDDARPESDTRSEKQTNTQRGACRWTLTGRGVRLRADLASPEDVTLDTDRRGTSV